MRKLNWMQMSCVSLTHLLLKFWTSLSPDLGLKMVNLFPEMDFRHMADYFVEICLLEMPPLSVILYPSIYLCKDFLNE